MRIGLVLPAVPAYSETFFQNKIKFLNATPGYEVIVFADRFNKGGSVNLCRVVYALQFSPHSMLALLQRTTWFVITAIRFPVKVFSLWQRNRLAGFTAKKNLASILTSAHIFAAPVDWLHFGFGTMAIGRENVAKVMGAKMAISFRGFDHYIYPLKHSGCYALLFSIVDHFHVLSNGMKVSLMGQQIESDRISVIPPAIDIQEFVSVKRDTCDVRKRVQFVTVARLHWIKGLEYTLEAMALLKNRGVDFHYTVIGEGEERERLIFAVHQLGLQQLVTFTGKLAPDEVVKALDEADIYLQYSIQEGFCNAVLEAQAMGLLCVVSDAEGLAENVIHGQTGWVVPKRRPVLLAQQIEEILSINIQSLSEIKNNAMKRVSEQFNLIKQKEEFISFYKS
jgi:glycosyltransferase involved in cell wall biosynthesis